jgi:hypothetical protein
MGFLQFEGVGVSGMSACVLDVLFTTMNILSFSHRQK